MKLELIDVSIFGTYIKILNNKKKEDQIYNDTLSIYKDVTYNFFIPFIVLIFAIILARVTKVLPIARRLIWQALQ